MSTTYKRVTTHLNKHEAHILEDICKSVGDSQSYVMRVALVLYHDSLNKDKEVKNGRK